MGFSPANLLFFLWAMTATVSGVVVDETGRPVADAEVRLSSGQSQPEKIWDSPVRMAGVRTSEDGKFRVERVAAGRTFELVVTRPGFAPSLRTVSTPKLGPVSPLRITLRPGRMVAGAVVDGEGKPAAGVEVELARSRALPRPDFQSVPPDRGLHQARTGSDGRFSLPDLPAGRFDLAAVGPGFRSPLAEAVQVAPGTEPLELGTFTLERRALEGRVRDPEGRPVAGAEVWLRSEDWPREWWATDFRSERPAAVTGADGRFEIPDVPSRGWNDLLVCRKGFVQAFAEPPAGEPVEVVLAPKIPFSGRVLDSRGEPVAGARVSAWLSGEGFGDVIYPQGPCVPDFPPTDAEGRFSLDLSEPGWYDVSAEAEGFLLTVREGVRVSAGEEVVLTLEAGVTVEGRVLDPDGEAIPGARIVIYDGRGFSSGASLADGSYRLVGIEPGSRSLEVEHPDYSGGSRKIEVPAEGKRLNLLLYPRPRREIRGRVLDPDGKPVEGALVSTVLEDRTTTDADGSFLLVAQDGNDEWLRAEKDGYGAGTAGPLRTPVSGVEIRLTRGVSLTGRLLGLEPEELARAAVSIRAAGAPERQAVLDAEGRYRILDLPPGEWTLFAQAGHRSVQEILTLPPDSPEAVHDLELPPVSEVRGRVTSPSGPLAGVEVFFAGNGRTSVRAETGEDGTFSVRLEDGDYSATASLGGYFGGGEGRSITVAGLPVDGLDFELEAGATLTGRILGVEPGRGRADLTASRREGREVLSGEVDQEGNYRISGLGPGTWKLEISFSPGLEPRKIQGLIDLPPGTAEMTLDLALGESIHFHRIPLRHSPEEP